MQASPESNMLGNLSLMVRKFLSLTGEVKANLQDATFTSWSALDGNTSSSSSLNKGEFESLCKLKNENNIVKKEADNGNAIAILDKDPGLS